MSYDDATDFNDEFEQAEGEVPQRRARRPLAVRILVGLLLVVLAACLFLVGMFAGDRWLRNDEAEIQGAWYVADTAVPVIFQGGRIQLSSDVSYGYSLDPGAKTIRYQLAKLEGQGRYWFSFDRRWLFIEDGDFSWWDTLLIDAARAPGELAGAISGGQAAVPEGEGIIALSRIPTGASKEKPQPSAEATVEKNVEPPAGEAVGGEAQGGDGQQAAEPAAGAPSSDAPLAAPDEAAEPERSRKLSDELFASVGEEPYEPSAP